MERLKKFWNDIVGNEVDYSQFETRNGDTDIIVFREKSSKFMLFGTNIHVVLGATIAATIGLMVTITFCIIYTFYHQRGQGRNYFIDHLELVDLIFALFFGLPCHYLLFYGIHRENKRYLTPFLIFYCTNFVLNVIFSSIMIIATIMDARQLLHGQMFYDFGWIIFQIGFTIAQGFAIYLVLRCKKYLNAKEHWKKISNQGTNNTDHSIIADGVVADSSILGKEEKMVKT
ncbi:putative integral membrane protein [Acanthocheilonema viteae]